jgi:polysaccharide pyruvyl transferase WcaK-like protein
VVSATVDRLHSLSLQPGEFVAVNVRRGDKPGSETLDQLAAGIAHAASECGAGSVLLFGMQSFRDNHDGESLAALRRRLPSSLRAVDWPDDGECTGLRGTLSQARLVVSCRYHGVLFALAAAVPALGVIPKAEYDVKMRGLFDWYGLDRLCVTLGEPIPREAICELAARDAALRRQLQQRNQELAEGVNRPYERIRELLGLSR